MSFLDSTPDLEELKLESDDLSDQLINHLQSAKKLKSLRLANLPKVTVKLIEFLPALKTLERLQLVRLGIVNPVRSQLKGLNNLNYVELK